MIWKGQLNVKNGTAKNKVTEEEAKMICKYCILCIKCSSNMLLFYNEDAFITSIMLWVYNSYGISIYCHP